MIARPDDLQIFTVKSNSLARPSSVMPIGKRSVYALDISQGSPENQTSLKAFRTEFKW
jgi:hypothetical protein